MDIIPSTAPKSLTSDTTFSNYILIFNAYSKIPKLYSMEKIQIEEVMDKLDMFQSIYEKIDKFGWWDLEGILADAGTQFTSTEFKEECQTCGSFEVSGTVTPGNERKSLSDMDNVVYNFPLSYGTY